MRRREPPSRREVGLGISDPMVSPPAADDAREQLSAFPLFAELPRETLDALAVQLRPVELRCGDALVRQGEPGQSLFLVVDGRLEVLVERPNGVSRIGVIGRGETVGEMAVITGEPRSASVIAIRRSSLLELPGDELLRVLSTRPTQMFELTRQIVRRAQAHRVSSPVRRIALLPLDAKVDIGWLAKTLVESLSGFGKAVRLGRAMAMAQLDPQSDLATVPRLSERFLTWLTKTERSHEYVVYEAMFGLGEWTHRCLAQADLVLLVGDAHASPALSLLEETKLGAESPATLAPRHLVLLHPEGSRRPSGTAAWLDARDVALHHHVERGKTEDVARLARIVAGRAVQLVLSGGGVRGFAHIGVLRAFEEVGLPVDLVGGASVGALIGGLCAMEWQPARMHEVVRRIVTGKPSVEDLTFPFVSIFAGRRGSRAVREMCDGWNIEDLPRGYFAMSADLCRAEEFVHRRGPLWIALRASGSIPGVFPPLLVGDRCLIDGGVLNNFPIDVMTRLAAGRIVAVDVSREIALDPSTARLLGGEDGGISGFRLLLRRLNPFRRAEPPLLNLGTVLARTTEMATVRIARSIQEQTPVTLRIEPPVDGYRMLDFKSIDAIVEAGYAHALPQVEAWKQLLLG